MRTAFRFAPLLVGALAACSAASGGDRTEARVPDVVALDSSQLRAADIALEPVGRLPADLITVTGTVTFDARQVSHVGPRTQGRMLRVNVDIGSHVRRGDTLALLDSPEIAAAQARWTEARATRDLAASNAERTERLFRDGIVSDRRRLEAAAELTARNAEFASAAQVLETLGAQPAAAATGLFVLRAPLDGEVVEMHAVAGEVAGPDASVFVVGELGRVWLLLDVFETDLARIREGLPARVVADAFPRRPFDATVTQVGSVVDSISRTVKVRLEVPNPDHALKPGMFARAAIAVDDRSGAAGVPREAVQTVEGRDVVFVPAGRGRFRPVPVVLGPPRAGGWLEVRHGPAIGDTIVVRGSFVLKAHLLRATFGGPE